MRSIPNREWLVHVRNTIQRGAVSWASYYTDVVTPGYYVPEYHEDFIRCRYCSEWFVPHPGFADHQDECPLNPLNRPHIRGTAVATYGP